MMTPIRSLAAIFTEINKPMKSVFNQAVKSIVKDQRQAESSAVQFNDNLRMIARMVNAELMDLMPSWLHSFLVKQNSNKLFQLSNLITGIKIVESLEHKSVKIFKRGRLIKTFYLGKDIIVS